jgi:hypothetical protein
MAKSTKSKRTHTLEDTLQASTSILVQTPKTVILDNTIVMKIKNIVLDFPEYKLSTTKLVNGIVLKWLDDHREELLQHHLSKSSDRY